MTAFRVGICVLSILSVAFLLGFVASEDVAAQRGDQEKASSEDEDEEEETRPRRPVLIDTVTWTSGEDQTVKLVYSNQLKVTARDYPNVEATKPGEVVQLTECAAPKLSTDLDLLFGDTLIETENVAEDYPGVYGLWLKKTDDGWRLVFNWKADVWGTMHDPKSDVAEVPLDYRYDEAKGQEVEKILMAEEAPKDAPRFRATMSEENGEVLLRIEWGPHSWSTAFKPA